MPEITQTVTIDFQVYCDKCGAGLCNQTTVDEKHGGIDISIAPCEACLKEAYNDGVYDGREESE